MKISKLLSIILGLSGFLRMGIVDGEGGGMGLHDAGAALVSLMDGDTGGAGDAEETEEEAAERLAAQDANQTADDSEQDPEEVKQPVDDEITVEVDGKTVTIKKSDLPDLIKGDMRQKDYTQKTMAASETVKAAEAEIAKARAEREEYATNLKNFAITTSGLLQEQQKVLTQELLDSDPVEYLRQQHIFQARQVELGKAQTEMQRLHSEHLAEQQEDNKKWMMAQRDTLLAAIPELSDAAKQKNFFSAVESYMEKAGFGQQDGKTVLDARVLLMADKAQKYDALMARAKETAGKVKAAPVKVERPGVAKVAPTDGRTEGMKRLQKTGSVQDAADILAGLM